MYIPQFILGTLLGYILGIATIVIIAAILYKRGEK